MKFILNETYLHESKEDEQHLKDAVGDDTAEKFLKIRSKLKSPANDIYFWIEKRDGDWIPKSIYTVSEKIPDTYMSPLTGELPDDLDSMIRIYTYDIPQYKEMEKRKVSEGATLIADIDGWKVYLITSYEAAKKYGKGTRWCVTGSKDWVSSDKQGRDHFISQGGEYLFFINTNKKVTFTNNSGETFNDYEKYCYDTSGYWWNAADESISLPAVIPISVYEQLINKENSVLLSRFNTEKIVKQLSLIKDYATVEYSENMIIPDNAKQFVKKIIVKDGVINISDYAFYDCTGLTSISIPDSVTSIGEGAFRYCEGLTSITIPNSVTNICHGAFYDCTGLKSITIPDSVTNIGDYAFRYCTGLTSISIPDSVTSIGEGAFISCIGLTSVTIGNNVTSIGDYAFYDCKSLTSITIPDSVTSIGVAAFRGCKSLTSIGVNVFYGCTGLTSVTISDSVTSITSNAFYGCKSLTSITIPDSVTSIGVAAFRGCKSLTSITIGNGVTSIGKEAFYHCTGLRSVTIGNSVTSISWYAFDTCISLTSITIPNSVTSIGVAAFRGCTGLTNVYYKGTTEQWDDIEIYRNNEALLHTNIHFNNITESIKFKNKLYLNGYYI